MLHFPRLVHDLAPIDLALTKKAHRPPRRLVGSIDEAARLHTEARSSLVTRTSTHVDVVARVELKGGLRAKDLQVDPGLGVMEEAEALKSVLACIEGHLGWVRCGIEHEAIVNLGRGLLELKFLRHVDGKGRVDCPLRYASLIDGQISPGAQSSFGPCNGRLAGKIEVAARMYS